jgi:hypothetical protein
MEDQELDQNQLLPLKQLVQELQTELSLFNPLDIIGNIMLANSEFDMEK